MSENDLTDKQVAQVCPHCPICGSLLIHRPDYRRFIENNRYVQCDKGHLWELLAAHGEEK